MSMTGPAICIDLPLNLIQVIRLMHALVEAGCRLHVTPNDVPKVIQLKKIFRMPYEIGCSQIPVLRGLSIDHLKPETRIGSITRPLVFPQAAFDYCRRRWPPERVVKVCFPGLLTDSRREAIKMWLKNSGLDLHLPSPATVDCHRNLANRISKKITQRLGYTNRRCVYSDGVKIIFSDEGRVFPRKAWNPTYYSWLLESQFVLCPSGDQGHNGVGWTYRFFEAILCGAIPVVQSVCDSYEGFRFRSMNEPLLYLEWSPEDAEYNFNLALKRMTVPTELLRMEINRLLLPANSALAGASSWAAVTV